MSSSTDRDAARRTGQFFTPPPLADLLAQRTLRTPAPAGRPPRICDPACGDGELLLAAGRRLAAVGAGTPARIARECLFGVELDEWLASLARRRLAEWAGIPPSQVNVRCGDALRDPPAGPFDAILANPPYVRVHRQAAELRRWLRTCGRFTCLAGDCDLYVAFIELAAGLLAPGGRMGIISSGKYLARRYGDRLRAMLAERAAVEEVWDISAAGGLFGADTYPVLTFARAAGEDTDAETRGRGDAEIRRSPRRRVAVSPRQQITVLRAGPDLRPTPVGRASRAAFVEGRLLAEAGTPPALRGLMQQLAALPRLGDLPGVRIFCGTPRARDYKAWGAQVSDTFSRSGEKVSDTFSEDLLPLVTCASITPGVLDLDKPVRVFGRRWRRPMLRRGSPISASRWADFAAAPKVLVRGNARRLTAAVDAVGCACVGVYGILGGPWSAAALAALLNGDVLVAWAALHGAQMAVAGGYITFNAPLLAALPLPPHSAAMDKRLCRDAAADAFALTPRQRAALACFMPGRT